MGRNLTGQTIASTYEGMVQISGSILTDGTGSNLNSLTVTASNAVSASHALHANTATSASHAVNSNNAISASFAATATSASFATTASYAENAAGVPNALTTASISDATITFTKGSGATFGITVNNVVNANSASVATSASFASTATSASFASTATSASYSVTTTSASFANNAGSASFATTATSASYATNAASSSYALTASYAENVSSPTLQVVLNAGNTATGSIDVSGSISATSFVGNLTGNATTATSASYASNAGTSVSSSYSSTALSASYSATATSASHALNADSANTATTATSASYATTALSASFASNSTSASYATNALSSSYALTASFALNADPFPYTGNVGITGNINLTGSYNRLSGSFSGSAVDNITDVYSSTAKVNHVITLTQAEYNAISASADPNTLYYITDAPSFVTSASYAATATSASHALNANNAISASFATTASFASNIASGLNITASNILVTNNLTVNGTASFAYTKTTTGSAVIIGDEFIILNADTPTAPYAGIMVYDTGSASTASFEWNGIGDYWITVEENGASAIVLTGLSGSKGSEVAPALNKLLKGTGNNTVADSSITDNGTNVTFTTPIAGTQISASTGFNGNLAGTASYADNANSASYSVSSTSASYALNSTSASYAVNSTSASYAVNSTSASYAVNATSASYAVNSTSASYAVNSTSASYALSASYAPVQGFPFTGSAGILGSLNVNMTGSKVGTVTSGSFNGTFVTNIIPSASITQSQIEKIVTLDFGTYTSLSGSGNVSDDTLYIISNTSASVAFNTQFSGSVRGEVRALTIASNTASMDLSTGNFFTLTLVSGSNTFINPTNILPGQTISLRVTQPNPGNGTVTFPSSVKQVSGSAYVATTGSAPTDIVTFISFDTASLFLSNVKNLV